MLRGPTPLWVSTYTSYLLYKVQDPFSAYRQSQGQNIFSSSMFREDQSLLHRSTNSGRECAWWTNSLVGQFLHQLSLILSAHADSPRAKTFFLSGCTYFHAQIICIKHSVMAKTMFWECSYTVVDQFSCG